MKAQFTIFTLNGQIHEPLLSLTVPLSDLGKCVVPFLDDFIKLFSNSADPDQTAQRAV